MSYQYPCDRCKRDTLPLIHVDMNARGTEYYLCLRCIVEIGINEA